MDVRVDTSYPSKFPIKWETLNLRFSFIHYGLRLVLFIIIIIIIIVILILYPAEFTIL